MFGPGNFPRIVAAIKDGAIYCVRCLEYPERAAVLDDDPARCEMLDIAPLTDYALECDEWPEGCYCDACGRELVPPGEPEEEDGDS